jgi:hypothetical protein
MNQPLYKISKEFMELQEAAANSDNVDESMIAALTDTLEGVQLDFQEKAKNIVGIMKNVTVSVTAIDEEIKRLQKIKVTATNKEKWFREYLRENMQRTGVSKIECDFFSITLSAPAKILEITSEKDLPDDLIDIETTIKPNKSAIKKLLDQGEHVDGAVLVDATPRLIIK